MLYARSATDPSAGGSARIPLACAPALLSAPRYAALLLGLVLLSGLASGCATVPVTVGNPIPGMTTVAVAPFFNLSAEPSVDGRRFALAYYSELQKTANYQVVPVGIVEAAIRENELDMSSPSDVLKLAGILDVDAVVVGAVTEYNPYYPPQLAVHIQWFSPREWVFYPGISIGDKDGNEDCPAPGCPPGEGKKPQTPLARGQSADDDRSAPFGDPPVKVAQRTGAPSGASSGPVIWPPEPGSTDGWHKAVPQPVPGKSNGVFSMQIQQEATQPIMSYTRFFDGADRELLHALRGYYYLRGDMRSGGWEAYLQRSDDFLRFTSYVLVMEMLSLHGAPQKTEKVILFGR